MIYDLLRPLELIETKWKLTKAGIGERSGLPDRTLSFPEQNCD